MTLKLAVIGGGWAGCAAAVQAIDEAHDVTLFEMAGQLGGRARRVDVEGFPLDNGQHIMIGAYTETLRLMRQVGVKTTIELLRSPLRLVYADGKGLQLEPGRPLPSLLRAIALNSDWRWRDRVALLYAATTWAMRGFRCSPNLSVAQLCTGLPEKVRGDLIDPLCVAALNTPAEQADATVFLRVLKDALMAGGGSSDLLLPRTNLSALFPDAAKTWLEHAGATIHLSNRVSRLERGEHLWHVDGQPFDAVVLACSPSEAARLARPVNGDWADAAAALPYEPIVTVYARGNSTRLPLPMLALRSTTEAPAQFVFDHGLLGGPTGLLAFVVSGAAPWMRLGLQATADAVLAQGERELARYLRPPLRLVRAIVEKRATFLCHPGLKRPPAKVAPSLFAAGDYVAGPYPATLEGAVRAGVWAARQVAAG